MKLWIHYIPALILFILGAFFVAFPLVAAFFVVGGLFGLGVLYGWLVYRFHKFQKQSYSYTPYGFEQDIYNAGGPSIRNISYSIFRRRIH